MNWYRLAREDVPLAWLFWGWALLFLPWRASGSVPISFSHAFRGMRAWLRGICVFFMLNLAQHELSKNKKLCLFLFRITCPIVCVNRMSLGDSSLFICSTSDMDLWGSLWVVLPSCSCNGNDDGYPFTLTQLFTPLPFSKKSTAYSCTWFFLSPLFLTAV